MKPEDEEEEVYFGGEEDEDTIVSAASETLDLLALNLSPESFVPFLVSWHFCTVKIRYFLASLHSFLTFQLQHVEPAITGEDIYKKKAAFLSIALLAEGCTEHVRSKYLETFLQCVCSGITSPAPVVRNAALFALGQFSEYLQPDVSKFADTLLPILFDNLTQICAEVKKNNTQPPSIDRMFYALEMFCENLAAGLVPYLPVLMDRLFQILDESTPVHVRELALSAVAAASNACKTDMAPYLEQIIATLNPYLVNPQTEETMCLRIQALGEIAFV